MWNKEVRGGNERDREKEENRNKRGGKGEMEGIL
jgi:hypothetical protein